MIFCHEGRIMKPAAMKRANAFVLPDIGQALLEVPQGHVDSGKAVELVRGEKGDGVMGSDILQKSGTFPRLFAVAAESMGQAQDAEGVNSHAPRGEAFFLDNVIGLLRLLDGLPVIAKTLTKIALDIVNPFLNPITSIIDPVKRSTCCLFHGQPYLS